MVAKKAMHYEKMYFPPSLSPFAPTHPSTIYLRPHHVFGFLDAPTTFMSIAIILLLFSLPRRPSAVLLSSDELLSFPEAACSALQRTNDAAQRTVINQRLNFWQRPRPSVRPSVAFLARGCLARLPVEIDSSIKRRARVRVRPHHVTDLQIFLPGERQHFSQFPSYSFNQS